MPSIVKPKVTAVKKVTAPKPKAVTAPKARAKTSPYFVKPQNKGLRPGQKPTAPSAGQAMPNVMDRVKAIFQQLQTFNPNTWGKGGPGTFQGVDTPSRGQSIQDIINNARR